MADLIAELEGVVRKMEHIKACGWNVDPVELSDARMSVIDFLRTHHAEIAAAVRDSQRIDFLQREVDEIGAFLLHNGKGRGSGFTGLGLQNTGRTLRQAIDQCIDAGAAMRAGEGEG